MKKKQTIAILLSVLLLTSVTLPGTWANEDPIDSENAETTPTPEEPDTDTEAETEEEPESESESETEEEPESETETETEPESETEPETEEPETEPETTETEPETTEPETEENPLYTSFNLLMEDESMDSKAKWDELRTLFALDDDMDVLTILNAIAQKLELRPDEFVKFFEQFRTIIETILDEIKDAVMSPDGIPALVEALMATDVLTEFESIVDNYLTENDLDVIFFEDPAEFDKVNDYYYYLENGEYPNHDPIVYDAYGNLISGDDGSLNENDTDFGEEDM